MDDISSYSRFCSIPAQQTYLDHAARLAGIAARLDPDGQLAAKTKALAESMLRCELIVPVVGAFSSGKSTMLNTLLGRRLLPTAISPETALAMELRYSTDERLEAVALDGEVSRCPVDAVSRISEHAENFSHGRLWLSSPVLKKMEPLVLVDMPGFEAPVGQHVRALLSCLDRGCHYLFLCDAEEGTLSRTLLRHMHEITDDLGRGVSLFLSKADLRTEEDMAEIQAHVRDILEKEFRDPVPLGIIDNHSVQAVSEAVAALNVNELFAGRYRDSLSGLCDDFLGALDIRLRAAGRSREELAVALAGLRSESEEIRERAEDEIAAAGRFNVSVMTGEIIAGVSEELSAATDEVASLLESGGASQASTRIAEILRSSLTVAMREKFEEIRDEICRGVSRSLSGLDTVMRDAKLDDAFAGRLAEKIKSSLSIDQMNDVSLPTGLQGSMTQAATVLSAVVKTLSPILRAVVLLLPQIISLFLSQYRRSEIRGRLESECYPRIKRRLREELPSVLEKQISAMTDTVREEYRAQLETRVRSISAEADRKSSDVQEQEKELQALEAHRAAVRDILSQIQAAPRGALPCQTD